MTDKPCFSKAHLLGQRDAQSGLLMNTRLFVNVNSPRAMEMQSEYITGFIANITGRKCQYCANWEPAKRAAQYMANCLIFETKTTYYAGKWCRQFNPVTEAE